MGVSTNAIIAFGFDIGEEVPESVQDLLEKSGHDIEEVLAADLGLSLPQWHAGSDYKAYSDARTAALYEIKIDLIAHCSGEYPMYFLAVRGSNKLACRGSPRALEPGDLDASRLDTAAIGAMQEFCSRHGIEWQVPKWHIFSMWD